MNLTLNFPTMVEMSAFHAFVCERRPELARHLVAAPTLPVLTGELPQKGLDEMQRVTDFWRLPKHTLDSSV